MMRPTAKAHASHATSEDRVPVLNGGLREIEKLYEALRTRRAKLVRPNGEASVLPDSLYAFLIELIQLLNQGKPVHITQNQAELTTLEAAAMLGVSRQFLVNLLKKGEVAHHMVGTHRRIYLRDLLQYKKKRDELQRRVIRSLAKAEAESGLYDRIPPTLED